MRARPVPKIFGTSSTKLTYFLTLLKKIFLPKNNLVFHFKAAFLMTRSLKTALKGHGLAGARHFSLGHQKSHGNFKVKKI